MHCTNRRVLYFTLPNSTHGTVVVQLCLCVQYTSPAPVVCNSLPLHLRFPSISCSQFQAVLKTHLFRLAFHWLFLWELLKRFNWTELNLSDAFGCGFGVEWLFHPTMNAPEVTKSHGWVGEHEKCRPQRGFLLNDCTAVFTEKATKSHGHGSI